MTQVPQALSLFVPRPPGTIEATGITYDTLEGLVLRTLYFRRSLTGDDLANDVGLPFYGVIEPLLEAMRNNRLIEITQGSMASVTYTFSITDTGRDRALQSFSYTTYVGVAPVSLDDFIAAVHAQTFRNNAVTWQTVQEAFRDLIFDESVLPQVGPAINSGRSIFLYGPPGNGKSSIAERMVRVLGDSIFIPECLEVRGQIIKLFDPFNHLEILEGDDHRLESSFDRRWRLVRRPFIIVGGELTLASLDLIWNPEAKYYEAPFQLKASGGGFLIDDFGRQREDPKALLNRWIVPLERRVDYLTLHTGTKIEIPFDEIIIFSTNLEPKDLVDEAFTRRIRYKIPILSPSIENFRRIWEGQCRSRSLPYEQRHVDHLLYRQIFPRGKPLRCCHARDILDIIDDISRFTGIVPTVNETLIDHAAETYFVSLDTREAAAKARMDKIQTAHQSGTTAAKASPIPPIKLRQQK